MITVWKYELEIEDTQWLEIPRGAKFLSVAMQKNVPCLWCQVDTEAVKDSILIVTHGTGDMMRDENMKHLGSYQTSNNLVFHVFVPA
jgi:hypothetical protein